MFTVRETEVSAATCGDVTRKIDPAAYGELNVGNLDFIDVDTHLGIHLVTTVPTTETTYPAFHAIYGSIDEHVWSFREALI